MSAEWQQPAKARQDLRPYSGPITCLSLADLEFFAERYEVILSYDIGRGEGRYLLPIYAPNRRLRGWVARSPWPGSPLSKEPHTVFPKADTYLDKPGPVQSWYGPRRGDNILVLVEDQLSAIKLAEMGYDAVAMLGVPNSGHKSSYSGQDRVAEIARAANARRQQIVVAFDADATAQSFLFVDKWRGAFALPPRVAILERDVKDTKKAEIPGVLGVSPI